MDKCLAGTWTLRNQGSDYLPGLDEIAGMTFSALLAPDSDCWLGINQKQSFGEVEEISFLFRSVRSETRFFQVGKLNFEKVGKEVILAIVSNTSPSFQECTITRYGPARGQKSAETYSLDESGEEVRVSITLNLPDGSVVNLIKYLIRCENGNGSSSHIRPIPFVNAARSFGWDHADYHSAFVFNNITVKLLEPIQVTTPNDGVPHVSTEDTTGKAKYAITKRFGETVSNGEHITLFEILVQHKPSNHVWIVPHRYREFDTLKSYIEREHDATSVESNMKLSPFPGKSLLSLSVNQLKSRVEMLEEYINSLIKAITCGNCTPNIIDVLCGFLEIPENFVGPIYPSSSASNPISTAGVVDLSLPDKRPSNSSVDSAVISAVHETENVSLPSSGFLDKSKSALFGNSAAEKKLRHKATGRAISVGTTTVTKGIVKPVSEPHHDNPGIREKLNEKSQWLGMADGGAGANDNAVDHLYKRLRTGVVVMKHGRSGNPKRRLLLCNRNVSRLYWSDSIPKKHSTDLPRLPNESKSIDMYDVTDVRKGTDYDLSDRNKVGTAILRRTCPPSELPLCMSLISSERSLDIQFLSQQDFDDIFPFVVAHVKFIGDNVSVAVRGESNFGVSL